MLHPEDLPLVVGVVRDVDELPHVRRVDLLVLAGDEHGADTDQLKLVTLDCESLSLERFRINDQIS